MRSADRPLSYTDVGHSRGSLPWWLKDDDVRYGQVGTEHHNYRDSWNLPTTGRIDPDKKQISIVSRNKDEIDYVKSVLKLDFPGYKIFVFEPVWGNPLSTTIVRVLSVVDTREYEEQGDKWIPIPGSGQESFCARCGRPHEILATVELSDGSTAVVGTSCAKDESIEVQRELKRGAANAKKLTALHHQVEAGKLAKAECDRIQREVDALPIPPISKSTRFGRPALQMGDAYVVASDTDPASMRKYVEQLVYWWRQDEKRKRGFDGPLDVWTKSTWAAKYLKQLLERMKMKKG